MPAQVVLAHRTAAGRTSAVAVKAVPCVSEDELATALAAAHRHKAAKHAHVIEVYDVVAQTGLGVMLVMELSNGALHTVSLHATFAVQGWQIGGIDCKLAMNILACACLAHHSCVLICGPSSSRG